MFFLRISGSETPLPLRFNKFYLFWDKNHKIFPEIFSATRSKTVSPSATSSNGSGSFRNRNEFRIRRIGSVAPARIDRYRRFKVVLLSEGRLGLQEVDGGAARLVELQTETDLGPGKLCRRRCVRTSQLDPERKTSNERKTERLKDLKWRWTI